MTVMRRLGAMVTALLLLTLLGVQGARAETFPIEGDLSGITGIAWHDGSSRLYAVTDQDPSGAVRVITADGQHTGTITFDADLESVQSISVHQNRLFVGDIGDPRRNRETISVYRLPARPGMQVADRFEFTYPDGPVDAMALAVSGRGRIYVVTAGPDPAIYRSSLEWSSNSPNPLTLVEAVDAPRGVTDAAFLADGATLLLRTAVGVESLDAFTWEQVGRTIYEGGASDESITGYGEDEMIVGGAAQLRIEPVPDGTATVTPEPPPEPEPETTPDQEPADPDEEPAEPDEEPATEPGGDPATEPGDDPAPDEATESEVARMGTILSLVGAAVVALLAAVGVFLARGGRVQG